MWHEAVTLTRVKPQSKEPKEEVTRKNGKMTEKKSGHEGRSKEALQKGKERYENPILVLLNL